MADRLKAELQTPKVRRRDSAQAQIRLQRAYIAVPTCAIQQRRTLVRKTTIYLYVLGLAVVAMTALASAGLVVSAQNSNSSMTMAPAAEKPAKKSRKPKTTAAATSGRCDPTQQEQTDLSGTYTGKVKHAGEPAMDSTLTITGNNFTMTSGSDTKSGRVTAVTTCGYTAATFMMGDLTPPTPSPNPPPALPAMSLRAKKVGDNLTLTSVPGEPKQISFTTGGGTATPKARKHKSKPKTTTGTTATPPPAKQ
jgi:hypothetical protein